MALSPEAENAIDLCCKLAFDLFDYSKALVQKKSAADHSTDEDTSTETVQRRLATNSPTFGARHSYENDLDDSSMNDWVSFSQPQFDEDTLNNRNTAAPS